MMSIINPKIDEYISHGCGRCHLSGTPDCKVHGWTNELKLLRSIILETGLTEELKWGVACYTFHGANILILSALKEHCVIGFFKGVLLKDPASLLVKPGEHSQAVRQFRFDDIDTIIECKDLIKTYIDEAVEVEKAGLKVNFNENPEPIPDELQERFEEDPVFRTAFEALTPGRRRGYIIHFSQPKQRKTREARIDKWTEKILKGEGMHDEYRRSK